MKWEEEEMSGEPVWENYWRLEQKRSNSLVKQITIIIRKYTLAPECAYYSSKTFSREKVLEAERVSAGTSNFISKKNMQFIALDLTFGALQLCKQNSKINYALQGDIFLIPFKNSSLGCIWDSSGMEQSEKEDIKLLLKEFNIILLQKSKVLFFWLNQRLSLSRLAYLIVTSLLLNLHQSVWDPTLKELNAQLVKARLKNIEIKTSLTPNSYSIAATK